MTTFDLPSRGATFWPVGNGDSVTICIDDDTVVQIDLNHRDAYEEPDDPRVPVVDRLVDLLPIRNGRPYLTALVITHHDADHCAGVNKLLELVDVDEMWITLRQFVELKAKDDLSAEGWIVYDEAHERRKAEIEAAARGERAAVGSRLLVIGYHDVLEYGDWDGFPDELVVVPGNYVTKLNEEIVTDRAQFFVHTPFQDDTESGSRNSSSLGMRVTLHADEDHRQSFLLLGDLEHAQIEAAMERTLANQEGELLEWDVLLAPHHGSRNAIRCQDDNGNWVDAPALRFLADAKADVATVVISSREPGIDDALPPHDDALVAYSNMVGAENVIFTSEHAQGSDSDPVVIAVEPGAVGEVRQGDSLAAKLSSLALTTGATVRPGDRTTGGGDDEFRVSDMVEQWRDAMAGSLAEFEAQLDANGFTHDPEEENTWAGEITVPAADGSELPEPFRIVIVDDFPFVAPKLYKIELVALSWHMNADGELCLYRRSEVADRPWQSFDQLVERVREWHRQSIEGWIEDFGVPDLNAYFPAADVDFLVSCPEPLAMVGVVGVTEQQTPHGWVRLVPAPPAPSRQLRRAAERDRKRSRRHWVYGVDIGALHHPVHDWDTLSEKLSDADRAEIDRLVAAPFRLSGLLVVNYSRPTATGGRPGFAVLLYKSLSDGTVTVQGVPTADESEEAMSVRAGRDLQTLSDKHVAIVGVGAIGSHIADLLARSGVREFTLVDPDRLEPGNCVRHLAGLDRVPQRKVDAVAELLSERTGVEREDVRCEFGVLTGDLMHKLLYRCDLVIDATASEETHQIVTYVSEAARRQSVIVSLFRDGEVAQARRVGHLAGPPTHISRIRDRSDDYREFGCGDPVSPAPPWATLAAAALGCRLAIDTMRSRRRFQQPDCVTDVMVAQPDKQFQRHGVVECPSS